MGGHASRLPYLRASINWLPVHRRLAGPAPVRRRSSGLRTRAEIVAAAERHFAERGFEATRLDDIALEVGIRRAAIFYHFGDKQELYAAVLEDVFRDWKAGLPTAGGAAERLEAALTGWIDYVARRPSVARMILREAAGFQPGRVSPFMRAGGASIEWFRALIEEGIASGELAPRVEPHRFLSLMGAMTVFHFAATPWLTLDRPADPWSGAELDAQKREILRVARDMLGISTGGAP
jgi:TetR/AcrR family transcriptional regulator